MPRLARVKSNDQAYHIMIKSIDEINLFRDEEDKATYLKLVRKYQLKYHFAVYAYCLMDNHGHLIIDCLGGDISKVMHVINFCYAQYYNKKYKRKGPVFWNRFKSIVIDSDRYMITLTAYIHNNPKDMYKYKNDVKSYPFSSLREYVNGTNTYEILDLSFIVSLIGLKQEQNKINYMKLIKTCNDDKVEADIEFTNIGTEYRDQRKIITRYHKPQEVINYVSKYLNLNSKTIHIKHRSEYKKIRAITCFLLNVFCNMYQREICEVIGNMTQSGISYLIGEGLHIVQQDMKILDKFIA